MANAFWVVLCVLNTVFLMLGTLNLDCSGVWGNRFKQIPNTYSRFLACRS
ncbi:hypothetical protein [Brunnivagina elsteri]|nr:hypothetical protein [Calothrix elsteri]